MGFCRLEMESLFQSAGLKSLEEPKGGVHVTVSVPM
jgi:hypothetical protein